MNRQQYICIKKLDPQIKARKQFIQILSILEKNQEFTVADIIPKLPKLRTSNQKTIQDNITRAIRFGKSIGILGEKVIASGDDFKEVCKKAKAIAKDKEPLFTRIPKEEETLIL